MLLVLVCWLATTPYRRFDVLDALHFERWIVLALALVWVFSRSGGTRYHRVAVAVGALMLVMALSYVLSDHQNDIQAVRWANDYWKELVLFFFIAYGISRLDQLATFLIGVAVISLAYQADSWLDFLAGGSYVYQQGIRRMVGVWSGGGIGSANEWGSFALYSLPLAIFWYRVAWSRLQRLGAAVLLILSVASVIFSGTRAAFVVSSLFALFHWRKQIFRPARLLLLSALVVVTWTHLPLEYRSRIELIWADSDSEQLSRTEQIAVESGEARIQGLKDGWALFLERPILGYGPGASQLARGKFHPKTPPGELEQLHSLYGQVLSELGALGALTFIGLIVAIFRATRLGSANADAAERERSDVVTCIRSILVLLLLYGWFTHSLYQYYWLLVAGLATAFAGLAPAEGPSGQGGAPDGRHAGPWRRGAGSRWRRPPTGSPQTAAPGRMLCVAAERQNVRSSQRCVSLSHAGVNGGCGAAAQPVAAADCDEPGAAQPAPKYRGRQSERATGDRGMNYTQVSWRPMSSVATALAFILVAGQAAATTLVSAPGTLAKAGETYQLTTNIIASGTAFQITANNIVLDLNGYTVTYDNSSTTAAYGVLINANNVKVANGSLIQGAQKTAQSHAISLNGSGVELHHLAISVSGEDTFGISATSGAFSSIHHVFVTSTSPSNSTGDPPAGIYVQSPDEGGLTIYNNIVVGAVRGVMVEFVGVSLFPNMPAQSLVYDNLLQPDRIYGSKGPYGILAARSSNVDIYSNQIVSDQGRGIILDGYEQGTSSGTTHCTVRNNLIDVQYSPNPRTGNGSYPENDVYGVRDRYGSGNNTISGNTIIADNLVGGDTLGMWIGSDAYEASMQNIVATSNTIISRNSDNAGTPSDCIDLDWGESVSITNNLYQCAAQFLGYGWQGVLHFTTVTETGNSPIPQTPAGAPSAPTGLHGRRLLDKVVLEWTPSTSPNTYEYRVYKGGKRISGSDVGGYFFIDTISSGDPVYTVSAVNLAGQESAQSAGLNLSATENGWPVTRSVVTPNPPTGVTVK